jgi:hypothetical protein
LWSTAWPATRDGRREQLDELALEAELVGVDEPRHEPRDRAHLALELTALLQGLHAVAQPHVRQLVRQHARQLVLRLAGEHRAAGDQHEAAGARDAVDLVAREHLEVVAAEVRRHPGAAAHHRVADAAHVPAAVLVGIDAELRDGRRGDRAAHVVLLVRRQVLADALDVALAGAGDGGDQLADLRGVARVAPELLREPATELAEEPPTSGPPPPPPEGCDGPLATSGVGGRRPGSP